MSTESIRTIFEGVLAEHLDASVLDDALRALAEVPAVGEVEIVIARDFAEAVKRRLSGEAAAAFDPNRITGSVGAKTLFLANGPCIVLDSRLLAPRAAEAAGIDVHFAYLAADHVVSAGERTIGTVSQSSSWTRYVGSNWDALISVLQPIPSASKGAEIEIGAVAGSLATALQAWLKDVGFDLSDVPGGVYFDVLRHDF